MKKPSWSKFDGDSFQRFGNAILIFEVSKFAKVFSSAGKDGGVDQLFTGTIEGQTGKWRFQDKFHALEERKGVSAFKQDVKKDIENHYKDEDFIVYLTNVNLGTADLKALEKIAYETAKKFGKRKPNVTFWHHATLETFIAKHPLLYNWFWERDDILVELYEDAFRKQLNADHRIDRYHLSNPFIGRESDLERIESFMKTPGNSTLGIIADGGYGKTRLCLEYFHRYVDSNEDRLALVLYPIGYKNSSLKYLLKSDMQLILLLDDAHKHADVLASAKRLLENHSENAKLIFTTRTSSVEAIEATMPNFASGYEKIRLEKLSREETKDMIISLFPGMPRKIIASLAENSKGIPNIILEYHYARNDGDSPFAIAGKGNFQVNVRRYLDETADDIHARTGINKKDILKTVQLISLIGPARFGAHEVEMISNELVINIVDLEVILTNLLDSGWIVSKNVLEIAPDPYSDVILLKK